MNLLNTLSISAILSVLPTATVASDVDEKKFCPNLADLESHMMDSMEVNTIEVQCASSELDMSNESFSIVCSMEGTHDDGSDAAFLHSERMVFKLNQGGYELSETSWSYQDSAVALDSHEVFYLDEGVVTSCKAKGCRSCTVCDDEKSIAVDCGNLEGGLDYVIECNEGYTGAFSHTFDDAILPVTPLFWTSAVKA